MSPDLDMAREVASLRRGMKRIKMAGGVGVLALLTVAMSTWVQPNQDTISAKMFFVLDDTGVPRGNFGMLSNGDLGLALTDVAGAARIGFRVLPDGTPKLNLYDQNQTVRTELTMDIEGTPIFSLNDVDGNLRLALTTSPNGAAQATFFERDGTTRRASLGTVESGRPFLLMWDGSGEPVFEAPSNAPTPGN